VFHFEIRLRICPSAAGASSPLAPEARHVYSPHPLRWFILKPWRGAMVIVAIGIVTLVGLENAFGCDERKFAMTPRWGLGP